MSYPARITSTSRSGRACPRRCRSASARPSSGWPSAIVFGYLSARSGPVASSPTRAHRARAGRHLDAGLLAGLDPALLLQLQELGLFPNEQLRAADRNPWQWAYHLVLPWISLAVLFVGFYSRVLRSNMLDVMNEDYVRTARAKGLSERQIMTKHVLRNSLIPVSRCSGSTSAPCRRRRDPHRDGVQHPRRRALRRPKRDQQPGPAADHGRHPVRRVLHRPLQHRSSTSLYAYLDPRIRGSARRPPEHTRAASCPYATCGSASPPTDGLRPGGRRRLLRARPGRSPGDRRRVRLRQERHRADDHGAHPRAQRPIDGSVS